MPKGLPWFRLYAEFAFDPKIQTTSETLQRRFVMLLCLKCNGDIPGLNDIQLSCALRISIEELHKTQKELVSIGVITENYDIPQWDKRQYRSDSSTERVKKYRSKNNGTLQKRCRNRNVTALSVSVSESKSVLNYLNLKSGKKFKNDKEILLRLKDGYTEDDLKKIIDVKLVDPHFIEHPQYLNPITLFRKSHIDNYLNQKPEDFKTKHSQPIRPNDQPYISFTPQEEIDDIKDKIERYKSDPVLNKRFSMMIPGMELKVKELEKKLTKSKNDNITVGETDGK